MNRGVFIQKLFVVSMDSEFSDKKISAWLKSFGLKKKSVKMDRTPAIIIQILVLIWIASASGFRLEEKGKKTNEQT